MRTFLRLLFLLSLAGCASPVPAPLREPPVPNPDIGEVKADPARFDGQEVLWGGTIARIDNRRESTEFELVARPLGGEGRPLTDEGSSAGRFLVRIRGFLDPAVYAQGRALTARGVVRGVVRRPIGEYDYTFPVLDAERLYLWPEAPRYRPAPAPWWYDDPFWPHRYGPFRDPWYPYWW